MIAQVSIVKARLALACFAVAMLVFLGGCSGGGEITVTGQALERTSLRGSFTQGIYRFEDDNHATLLLVEGPIENPTQAATIRFLWSPWPGSTPIDETATNATIQYIIFTGEGNQLAGIYTGAGFAYPNDDLGDDSVDVGVWEANLRLTDSTRGFQDLLGQALLRGSIRVHRDDTGVSNGIRRLNVMLRERLGYPRVIDAGSSEKIAGR